MKIKEKSRVLKTETYELFKVNESLRLSKKHLRELTEEMLVKNLSPDLPIIVDEEYNILDGRYRFLANKAINQPIYYKVAEVGSMVDLQSAKDFNKTLTPKEWCIIHRENENYRKLLDWCNKFHHPFRCLMEYTTDVSVKSRPIYTSFKQGEFVFTRDTEYKMNFIEWVHEYWAIHFGSSHLLSLDEVEAMNTGDWLKQDVIEVLEDRHGFIRDWFVVNDSGHPYGISLSGVLSEIDDYEELGHLEGEEFTYLGTKLTYRDCPNIRALKIVKRDLEIV